MSEKYEPSQQEYAEAKSMLTPEQAEWSKDREKIFYAIEDEDALKDSDLIIQTSQDGQIATVTGRVRDHQVLMMCKGMKGIKREYIVQIDGFDPVEEQDLAEDLFRKYYNIALAQKI